MAKPTQFRGTPAMMKAFCNVKIAAWAVFYDKQLLHKFAGTSFQESEQELSQLLKGMEGSNTSATYTLCLYEGVKERKQIKPSTEPDFSYNFTLFDNDEYLSPGTVSRREGYALILDKLSTLETKVELQAAKDLEEQDDGKEEIGSVQTTALGAINKILDNPKVQQHIGDKFCDFIDNIFSTSKNPAMEGQTKQLAASMGDVQTNEPITQITQEQADKINNSVQILAGLDPNLGDNLERIANLAQKNPKKYRSLITMLNTFI